MNLVDYPNVSMAIGSVLSAESPRVTLRDLDEHHGVEDLYDLLEVIQVNAHNRSLVRRKTEAR